MKLLDFINTHDNWDDLLIAAPYKLTIKYKGAYVLFMYNQLESDMTLPEVLEARGSIFTWNEAAQKYECVCRPFDKFFNYGEVGASEIDWKSAYIMEKVDGSLIKLWYHKGGWHISTNGSIDAFDAKIADGKIYPFDFGLLFIGAFTRNGGGGKIPEFLERLDKRFTYMFELVSPETQLIVKYDEPAIYYLGKRCTETGVESGNRLETNIMRQYGIKTPKVYPLRTLEDCVAAVENFSKQEEGFVVNDKYYNRVKIKSPAYLEAHRIHNNGLLTPRRIVNAIKFEVIDDIHAYAIDSDKRKIEEVVDTLLNVCYRWEWDFAKISHVKSRGELAKRIKDWDSKDYIFFVTRQDEFCRAFDFLKKCTIPYILRVYEKERGVEDGSESALKRSLLES